MIQLSPIMKNIIRCAVMSTLIMPGTGQAMNFDSKYAYLFGGFLGGALACYIGQALWHKVGAKVPERVSNLPGNAFVGYFITIYSNDSQFLLDTTHNKLYSYVLLPGDIKRKESQYIFKLSDTWYVFNKKTNAVCEQKSNSHEKLVWRYADHDL